MPLKDHFHPPLFLQRSWESFHNSWADHLAGKLNLRPMPRGFLAESNVRVGVAVAVDVATFEGDATRGGPKNGAVAAVWAPPQPPLVVEADFAALEVFELRVYDEHRARALVAAVELVSPANKDRPESRRAFLDKCAAYLREGVSLVIVDIVTSRKHNFHASLIELFGGGEAARAVTTDLYAVAYRVRNAGQRTQMEMWPAALSLGEPLPTLPLWLAADLAVPLDLDAGYRAACEYAIID